MSLRSAIALVTTLLLVGCPAEIPIPVDPPVARADYARTALDTPVTLSPLLNDFDPNSEALSVLSIGIPAHGAAVLNVSGTVDYTPNTGYLGGDQFDVTIVDASGNEATATAYVTVGPSLRMVYASNFVDYFTNQLYLADAAHPGFAIPVSGYLPTTVGPVRSDTNVDLMNPSADGAHLLYRSDNLTTSNSINLFHVAMDQPGVATQLTDLVSGQALGGSSLPVTSPDGLYAYYLSNEFNPATFEIVRVEIANPANKVRINAPLQIRVVIEGGVPVDRPETIPRFELTDDGAYILYAKLDPDGAGPGIAARALYVVDLTNPGVATQISGTPTTGTDGVVEALFYLTGLGFRPVPGTDYAIYPATENGSTVPDLYLVDYVAQTAPVKLSGVALGTVGVSTYALTPDATQVVYASAEDVSTVRDLYLVALATPGVATRLSELRTGTANLGQFAIGADGTYVLYVRDDDTADVPELYRVDFAAPGVTVKLNHALRPVGTTPLTEPAETVSSFAISAGAPRTVIYATNDLPVDGVTHRQMYAVSVDAPAVTTVIGVPFISDFGYAPDGDSVVFRDDPTKRAITSLYLTTLSAPTVVVKLSPEAYPGATASAPRVLP